MLLKRYLLIFLLFMLCIGNSIAQSIEYSVKAAYVEKIARFTEWKTDLTGDCFVIDVLGKSPFNGEIENMAKKVKIKNKVIKINYVTNYLDIKDCQLLFICASEKSRLQTIIKHIESLNILTISDTPGFCKKGVHVNFYIDENETLKYEINPNALKRANITVDIQLINYGEIIN